MPSKRLGEVGRAGSGRTTTSDLEADDSDVQASHLPVRAVDFPARVEELIKRAGGPGALAKRAHISRRMIDNYRGGSEIGLTNAIALADAGGVSLEWLAGRHPLSGPVVGAAGDLDPRYVRIPRYDVQAAAGPGAVVDSEQVREFLRFDLSYLRVQLGLNPESLVILEASGDSMTPTIRSGDLLLVDTRAPQLRGDGIYVLAVEDTLLVKRLSVRVGSRLVISSDNAAYPPEEVDKRDIGERLRIVGRVVWTGGPV